MIVSQQQNILFSPHQGGTACIDVTFIWPVDLQFY